MTTSPETFTVHGQLRKKDSRTHTTPFAMGISDDRNDRTLNPCP